MEKCGSGDAITSRIVIVQGGLSSENDPNIMEKVSGCVKAASRAYDKLLNNGNADEAVVDAIWWLENDEFFNCGYGSFFNNQGQVEMDATLMNGTTMKSGSVLALKNIEHPILIAKKVMDNLPNRIVTNEIIKNWNNLQSNIWVSPGNMIAKLQNVEEQKEFQNNINSGCSGCLVWDGKNMSAGSSSGGRINKYPGTISEAGTIGSGIYATELASCVITGSSDLLHKLSLAREIVEEITEIGSCSGNLLQKTLDKTTKEFDDKIGGIVLQSNGCHSVYFTSSFMPYAIIRDNSVAYGWKIGDRKYEKIDKYKENEFCQCD